MARSKKIDLDLTGYESMTSQELKNSACRLLTDKFSLQDQRKDYMAGANEAIKEMDARLEHIVVVLKTKESGELEREATHLLASSGLPSKPKI